MLSDREQALRALVGDPDEEVRKAVGEALEKVEAGMQLETIIGHLEGDNRAFMARAILSLGKIHSEQAIPPLIKVLSEGDANMRGLALQVLGEKKHPKTIMHIGKHLKDPDPAVRVHAADALGNFPDKRLVPHLAALLGSDDDALVCSALTSLGKIGVPEAEEPIIGALRDPRPSVRKAAVLALAELEV